MIANGDRIVCWMCYRVAAPSMKGNWLLSMLMTGTLILHMEFMDAPGHTQTFVVQEPFVLKAL